MTVAAELEILRPGFRFDSAEVDRARERKWYARTEKGPLVLRHKEAVELDKDNRLGPNGSHHREMMGLSNGPVYDWFEHNLQNVDAATHSRLRSMLLGLLPRHADIDTARHIRETVWTLAERMANRSAVDWMQAFADPLPVAVLCRILGIPVEQSAEFARISADSGLILAMDIGGVRDRAERAVADLHAYVSALVAQRRGRPRDDRVSRAVAACAIGDDDVIEAELHNLLMTLIMGGRETTARQLGWLGVAFARAPDQWVWLRDHPEAATQAAWEVLRWGSVVRINLRWPGADLVYQDLEITHGTPVLVCHAAADRDPTVFERPHDFDIRTKRGSVPLAFGRGIHRCVGSALALLQLTETLRILPKMFEPPVFVGDIRWRPESCLLYGPEFVPVSLAPVA
ncbi:cytochrome P450 [Nocardia sp. NPDC057455]|uniref:cytochrome P450 n=1 Tax=Nocardia sp. NPDC057455 TaxID=3346138 RepID=UPI003670DCF3